jgi:hypothetical protein
MGGWFSASFRHMRHNSALATESGQKIGYKDVRSMDGGFKA